MELDKYKEIIDIYFKSNQELLKNLKKTKNYLINIDFGLFPVSNQDFGSKYLIEVQSSKFTQIKPSYWNLLNMSFNTKEGKILEIKNESDLQNQNGNVIV